MVLERSNNQLLEHFEKSLITLKEMIAKTQTATTTSNTQMGTAAPNYSCRSITKGRDSQGEGFSNKVLQVNCLLLSPSTQVSAALTILAELLKAWLALTIGYHIG